MDRRTTQTRDYQKNSAQMVSCVIGVLYSCGVRPTSEIIVIVFVVSRLFYFYFYKYISCRLLLIRGNSSLDCQFPLDFLLFDDLRHARFPQRESHLPQTSSKIGPRDQ